jgi:serine protease Do
VAAGSGFQAGDKLVSIAGQPPLSFADIQWVLHQTDPAGAVLPITVDRQGELKLLTMKLADGWRTADDISWRVSAWGYRRIALGGLVLKTLDDDGREQRNIAADKMALLVSYVGQYDAHAAAKRAGFQKDDVIVRFDGRDDLQTETAVFQHVLTHRKIADQVEATVIRAGQRMTFKFPIQE